MAVGTPLSRFLRHRRRESTPMAEDAAGRASAVSSPALALSVTPHPTIAGPDLAYVQTEPAAPAPRPPKLSLVAHVRDLGDREADENGWVGDKTGVRRRIEGFTLHADVSDWRDLCTYQAVLLDGSLGSSVPGDSYCGTRGKSMPLHGFVVAVPQERPELHCLVYEGVFADGFRSAQLRPGELCRSPSNAALVAMRISAATTTETADNGAKQDKSRDRAENPDPGLAQLARRHNGVSFLAPTDLSRTPPILRRVALVGSCFLRAWNLQALKASTCAFDVFTINNAANLPDTPAVGAVVSDYDFQIVQLSMRSFFHDDMLTKLPYADIGAHEKALDDATQRMAFQLSCSMKWNVAHGLLTFVANFPLPQRNVFGVLFPRFDIRNPEHFIYLLNERLESLVRSYRNAYILDVDRISASFGRRFIQDDIISTISHNSTIGTDRANWNRIEPMAGMMEHYDITWSRFLGDAVWAEALLMYRVIGQNDQVKLVIVDLDDTLWHGTSGDADHADGLMLAGWPEGLTEALLYLKKRGILLAIVSKNEESLIRAIWPRIFGTRLSLEDFSAVRINWRPKAENISEVLSLVNLLPRSVVFIDDNPAERAAVQGAFPDIRVLGRHPYYLRRILLWSSETQNAAISEVSERRTEMVKAQIVREETRASLSREAFLAAAAPKIEITYLSNTEHPHFSRALELINKTNQFNTTGKRRVAEEIRGFFSDGGRAFVFSVTDAFTSYGLVGVVLVLERSIEQWVMSCRVIGLEIELAVMAYVVAQIRQNGPGNINGILVPTDANFPCRDLFQKSGFSPDESSWSLPDNSVLTVPSHVTIIRATVSQATS